MITIGVLEADLSHKNSMVYVRYSRAREVDPEGSEMQQLRQRMKAIIENSKNSHDLLKRELSGIDSNVRQASNVSPNPFKYPQKIGGYSRK